MKKQKKVFALGITLVMIFIVFAGCTENNDQQGNGNKAALSYVDVEVLSATDSKIADDACTFYLSIRSNQSKNESLTALITQLTSNSDAKVAELLDDDTVWIEFQDGKVMTISEHTTETYDSADEEYDYYAFKNNLVTESYISDEERGYEITSTNIMAASSTLPPLGTAPVTGDKEHSPSSKKILFMSAATESFNNQDVDLFNLFSGYLIHDFGWNEDDITIKYNAESDEYHTLNFDDFFHLQDYGVIVILAHGFYNQRPIDIHDPLSPEENFLYTQVRAAGTPEKLIGSYVVDTAEEYLNERIIYGVEVDPFKKTTTAYFYIRHDLWFEKIGTLPNSLLFLLHCQRDTGEFIFPSRNVGNYIAWDNPVSPNVALDSTWLIPYMAVADRPAAQILHDMIRPKTSSAPGTLELYPSENDNLYLPAWIDITLTSHPSDCTQITIDISYEDTTITPPNPSTLTESKDSLPHTFTGLIPGKRLKISAKALDSTGNVIRLKETTVTLTTGENTLEMAFPSTSYSFRFIEKYTETSVGSLGSKKPEYRWRYYLVFPMISDAKAYYITIHLNGHPAYENQQDNQQNLATGYPPETVWDEVDEWRQDFENGTRFYMIGGYDQMYEYGGDLSEVFASRDAQIECMQQWTFDFVPIFARPDGTLDI